MRQFNLKIATAAILLTAQAALQSCGVINFNEGEAPRTPQSGSNSGMSSEISPYDQKENQSPQLSESVKRAPVALFCSETAAGEIRALSVDSEGTINAWRISGTGEAKLTLKREFGIATKFAALSPDGSKLALGTDREPVLISLVAKEIPQELPYLRTRVASLDFSSDGKKLLAGGVDGRAYVIDISGELDKSDALSLERYVGSPSIVSAVAFHVSNRVFFSADWQGRVYSWLTYDASHAEISSVEELFGSGIFSERAIRHNSAAAAAVPVQELVLTADGEFFFISLSNGAIEAWRVRGFHRVAAVQAHKGFIYDLSLSKNGKVIATLGRDGNLNRWELLRIETLPGDPEEYTLEQTMSMPISNAAKICALNGDNVLVAAADSRVGLKHWEAAVQ